MEHIFIRGGRVRFVIVPDMLKNAPMVGGVASLAPPQPPLPCHVRRRRPLSGLHLLTVYSPRPRSSCPQFKRIDPKNKMKSAVLGVGGRGRAVADRANRNVGRI